MRTTERVTLTLPRQLADEVRARVEAGAAESTSAYLADLLADRFREENVERLIADMEAVGGPGTEADRDWALETVRLAGDG